MRIWKRGGERDGERHGILAPNVDDENDREKQNDKETKRENANVHRIHQGRLAVIDVGNDGNVAHGVVATGRRVDLSLLLHRSSTDADRGGMQPRPLLERRIGNGLRARRLDCTSANQSNTCITWRHWTQVISICPFVGVHADYVQTQRERGHMRTGNHPQRHVARREPSRQKLGIPRCTTAKNISSSPAHAHSTIREDTYQSPTFSPGCVPHRASRSSTAPSLSHTLSRVCCKSNTDGN